MSVKWRGKQGARRGMGGKSSINLSIVFGFWAGVNSQEQRRRNRLTNPLHCTFPAIVYVERCWIGGYLDIRIGWIGWM